MSAGGAPVYLLPPRPRLHDWPLAGGCAGSLLGLAELAVAWASGVGLPTSLTIGLAATDALLIAALAGIVGVVTWQAGLRPSHSGLVGAVLGIEIFAAVAAPLVAGATTTSAVEALLAAAACGALGFGAARVADRTERAGVPASGPLVWGAAGLLVAGASRLAYDGVSAGRLAGLGFAAGVIAAGVALAHELGRRRGSGSRMRFGRLLALLGLAIIGLALAPAALPWLLFERDLTPLAPGPPNILLAVLPGTASAQESVQWQSLGGRRYPLSEPGSPRDPGFPRLPDGSPLASRLFAAGYATALICREPCVGPGLEGVEVDDRPGAAAQLEGEASWLAAAALWRTWGRQLLDVFDLDGALRSPAQIGTATRRWLERWRTSRSLVPFFLRVDFRGDGADPDEVDRALGEILDTLPLLDAGASTLIALAAPGSERNASAAVQLQPPLFWRTPVGGRSPVRRLSAGELATALDRAAHSSPEHPPALP